MKTAKLGAIFLISVMALAGIGAGYSAWTDTITVTGTVNTGNVDINVEYLSGTYIYKTIDDHGLVYWHGWNDDTHGEPAVDNILVASATADFVAGTDDAITVTANNLFPCQWFMVDFLIHYTGSVPGRINALTIDSADQWLLNLYNNGHIGYAANIWTQDPADILVNGPGGTQYIGNSIDLEGYQLHDCNYIYVKLWIHIPQDNTLMGLTGSFTASLGVIQWNEYGLIY